MATYNQPAKNDVRELIWDHAIGCLCGSQAQTILKADQLREVWDECAFVGRKHNLHLDVGYVREFEDILRKQSHPRNPTDLRVLFLSGEEPENDVECLLKRNVRIENIWAVECDAKIARSALSSARRKHPTLKIFQGKIEDFLDITPVKFDVIYLDFTAPLLSGQSPKPIAALHKTFLRQALAPLSCLTTNYTVPDPDPEMDKLVACYFYQQPMVERSLLDECSSETMSEGPTASGVDPEQLQEIIANNRNGAYSAFYTHYPIVFSSIFAPADRALGKGSSRRLLLKTRKFELMDFVSPDMNWMVLFLEACQDSWLKHELCEKRPGAESSLAECVALYTSLTDVPLSGRYASDRFRKAVFQAMEVVPDRESPLFCDLMMSNIWAEYMLLQIGTPSHANIKAHVRYRYRAKMRTMFVDQFVLDQCRPCYDYLGFLDLLGAGAGNLSVQILVRCCLDLLRKNTGHMVPELFFGANLIAYNQLHLDSLVEIKPRIDLSPKSEK